MRWGAVDRQHPRLSNLGVSWIAAPLLKRSKLRTVAGAAAASPDCARREWDRRQGG